MAEAEKTGGEDPSTQKHVEFHTQSQKGSSSKLPFFLILAHTVTVVAGLGIVLYSKFLYKKAPPDESTEHKKQVQQLEATPSPYALMVSLDPLTINLVQKPNRKTNFAILKLAIECRDMQIHTLVEQNKPKIIDKTIQQVSNYSYETLQSIPQQLLLKNALAREFNQIIGSKDRGIQSVQFMEFMMQ